MHGPAWAFYVMIFVAGMTALYTFRCVYLVFYAKPTKNNHPHQTGVAMKVALLPLAIGAVISWLVAGPFHTMLAGSLPFHEFEVINTWELALEILTAPATALAMAVILIGLAIWWQRKRLQGLFRLSRPLDKLAEASFGFEAINRGIVRATQGIGEALRFSQTGELAWNVVGIALGLIFILAILVMGA